MTQKAAYQYISTCRNQGLLHFDAKNNVILHHHHNVNDEWFQQKVEYATGGSTRFTNMYYWVTYEAKRFVRKSTSAEGLFSRLADRCKNGTLAPNESDWRAYLEACINAAKKNSLKRVPLPSVLQNLIREDIARAGASHRWSFKQGILVHINSNDESVSDEQPLLYSDLSSDVEKFTATTGLSLAKFDALYNATTNIPFWREHAFRAHDVTDRDRLLACSLLLKQGKAAVKASMQLNSGALHFISIYLLPCVRKAQQDLSSSNEVGESTSSTASHSMSPHSDELVKTGLPVNLHNSVLQSSSAFFSASAMSVVNNRDKSVINKADTSDMMETERTYPFRS